MKTTTEQQLTPAEIRLAQYGERGTWSNATYGDGTEKALHEIAIGLKAEVDRLRSRVAELVEERRLEWQTSHARNPHTPLLCECGHSHFAHTVPAPHSCFAFGQTCPCQAYRQLPHDEAVAQLKRNQQAAAERAAAEEPHVVADDSDDPEHVDDCPGCTTTP
ncbi:hypothetical protein ACIRJM_23120 [Streptomyces sp. NPDC102405]|uniref:hypothetical protein n=1 Tax=Streptomyces sp. NPDC102405 TaxID=3366170 RepID=UPI0038035962